MIMFTIAGIVVTFPSAFVIYLIRRVDGRLFAIIMIAYALN
jgi:hypothetical protein